MLKFSIVEINQVLDLMPGYSVSLAMFYFKVIYTYYYQIYSGQAYTTMISASLFVSARRLIENKRKTNLYSRCISNH